MMVHLIFEHKNAGKRVFAPIEFLCVLDDAEIRDMRKVESGPWKSLMSIMEYEAP